MSFKKEVQEYLHFLRKKWNYSRDLFTPKQLDEFKSLESELKALEIERGQCDAEKKRLELAGTRVEKLFPSYLKPDGWAENIEVFFVAIVLALAIRTYFYQPFKIPTDSMKPTLWGIAVQEHPDPLPNPFQRVFELAAYGKSYHQIVAAKSGTLKNITEETLFRVRRMPITVTKVTVDEEVYTVFCSRSELFKAAPELFSPGRQVKEGEVLARFERLTGDQVFVNRWSYHFRTPRQGEVFVFTTHNIPGILTGHNYETEQYYIKRCVGVPGVTLQIKPPYLLSNHEVLGKKDLPFQRIYSKENGYSGYIFLDGSRYLKDEDETMTLPDDKFWAMGDNSPRSSDSRVWGYVPRENLIGTGSFVYWPFGKRWGWIK